MIAEELYDLKLHETMEINDTCSVMGVVGGWIYKFYDVEKKEYLKGHNQTRKLISTTFVKEN